MKAIILAGGFGTRLYPLTRAMGKQLQAVYDKPLIYYPLTALIAAGIHDFCIISDPETLPVMRKLLGDGSKIGISIAYLEQPEPAGVAEAYLLAEDYLNSETSIMMLGDNLFSGGNDISRALKNFKGGAQIFAYRVNNPQEYGVIEFDKNSKPVHITEKPTSNKSKFAIPGAYIYDSKVIDIVKRLRPSHRNELEISDVNKAYLELGELKVNHLSRGFVWLDIGTPERLHEASMYIQMIEKRQGIKIGCPEEAALIRGRITPDQFNTLINSYPRGSYRDYLTMIHRELK